MPRVSLRVLLERGATYGPHPVPGVVQDRLQTLLDQFLREKRSAPTNGKLNGKRRYGKRSNITKRDRA